MRNLIFFVALVIAHCSMAQTQEPIYVNFYDNYINYDLNRIDSTNTECIRWELNTTKEFPNSFVFQLVDSVSVFDETKNYIDALGFTVTGGDSNCSSGNGVRAEAALRWNNLPESTTNISYYKIKFYIPNTSILSDYSGEHNIFQITTDEVVDGSQWDRLAQFLLQIRHNDSEIQPKLELNYGLEFKKEGCNRAPLDPNTGLIDVNNVENRCGDLTSRQRLGVYGDYGWNEMLFEIRWSSTSDGWMNVCLNGTKLQSPIPNSSNHTFKGHNLYNKNMFPDALPLPDGDNGEMVQYMKLGQYRFGTSEETNIYYEYFYADSDLDNIGTDFQTEIVNDNAGIMDMHEGQSLVFKNVDGADEYVLLLHKDGVQQYKGNADTSMTYQDLLDVNNGLDLQFYTDYVSNVRVKYNNKGFNGKYSDPKIIRLEPDTKLSAAFCGRNDIRLNETLTVDKIEGADSYVLYIYDVNNPSNDFYHAVPQSGQILAWQLFQNLGLSLNTEYRINSRAKFDQFDMQGSYSTPCSVQFKPGGIFLQSQGQDAIIYPNPFNSFITIDIKSESSYKVEIYSFNGILLKEMDGIEITKFDLSQLKSGNYFVKIIDNHNVQTRQIIKY